MKHHLPHFARYMTARNERPREIASAVVSVACLFIIAIVWSAL